MLLLLHDFLLDWYNVKISFFLFISQPSIKKINGGKLKHSKVSNNNKKNRLHHLKMYSTKQKIVKSEMAHLSVITVVII